MKKKHPLKNIIQVTKQFKNSSLGQFVLDTSDETEFDYTSNVLPNTATFPRATDYMLQGCLDWQKDGMTPPQIVTKSAEEYRLDQDPILQFITESCSVSEGHRAQALPLGAFFCPTL